MLCMDTNGSLCLLEHALYLYNLYMNIPSPDFVLRNSDGDEVEEGRKLLIQEFEKKYSNYFSIFDVISSGLNTQSKIEAFMGE